MRISKSRLQELLEFENLAATLDDLENVSGGDAESINLHKDLLSALLELNEKREVIESILYCSATKHEEYRLVKIPEELWKRIEE